MINVQLKKAEAILLIELIHDFCKKSIENIDIALQNELDKEEVQKTARNNYVANLEKEVQRLSTIEEPPEEAPYGLKKDGTPRARPGRKTAKTAKKGKK